MRPQVQDVPWKSEICPDCRKNTASIYCGRCTTAYCDFCWPKLSAHQRGDLDHPHISVAEYRSINDILHPTSENSVQREKYEQEVEALWFSVNQAKSEAKSDELELEETPRFSQLISQYRQDFESSLFCYPRLVSFIGNTGAGKSSLIHLLMKHPWDASQDAVKRRRVQNLPLPVVGQFQSTVPTSGDVHLYCDPLTATHQSQLSQPLLFADCEGFHGGDQLPAGHRARASSGNGTGASNSHVPFRKLYRIVRHGMKRILSLPSRLEPRRKTAIGELFPRILYNFSDVVVHVVISSAARTLEEDIAKLLVWAQSSRAAAVNRALLPHLIVVLNMSDPNPMLDWDPATTTAEILKEQHSAIVKNVTIREYKEDLERMNIKINTLEDLLKCSYSSVQFIRVPEGRNRALLSKQLQLLHDMLDRTTVMAQKTKADAKMLLHSDDLNTFFRLGFDHYATNLDKPFSFLETVFSLNPLPNKLASNYYNIMRAVKAADQRNKTKRSGEEFCKAVVPTICTAITLDIQRSPEPLPGRLAEIYRGNSDSAGVGWDVIPGTYLSQLRDAVKMFEDHDCPCDFVSPDGRKCINLFLSHKQNFWHQSAGGKTIGFGPFQSQFQDELNKTLDNSVSETLTNIEKQLEKPAALLLEGGVTEAKLRNIWDIHESSLRQLHSLVPDVDISDASTCSWCFRQLPAAILPCRHGICRACIVALADRESSISGEDSRLFRIDQCMLHSNPREFSLFRVLLLPEGIDRRLLILDSDDDRSKRQLDIFAAIEERFEGRIPVRSFFDMIGGSGTGGLLALGLGLEGWTAQEASSRFRGLISGLQETQTTFWDWFGRAKPVSYQTKPWEDAIKRTFDLHAKRMLQTKSSVGIPNVFVVATKEDGKRRALIANYVRPNTDDISSPSLSKDDSSNIFQCLPDEKEKDAPFDFVNGGVPDRQFKVWEAARATTAIPGLFEHFRHASQQIYLGGPESHPDTARAALHEARLVWPMLASRHLDLLLSIGGKRSEGSAQPDTPPENCYIRLNTKPLNTSLHEDNMTAFEFVDLETAMEADPESFNTALDSLVYLLISTSFYFEPSDEPHEDGPGRVRVQGLIRCRFVDGSDEIKALGDIFHCLRGTRFMLDDGLQTWILDESRIKKMSNDGAFSLSIAFSIETSRSGFTIKLATSQSTKPISACPISIGDLAMHI